MGAVFSQILPRLVPPRRNRSRATVGPSADHDNSPDPVNPDQNSDLAAPVRPDRPTAPKQSQVIQEQEQEQDLTGPGERSGSADISPSHSTGQSTETLTAADEYGPLDGGLVNNSIKSGPDPEERDGDGPSRMTPPPAGLQGPDAADEMGPADRIKPCSPASPSPSMAPSSSARPSSLSRPSPQKSQTSLETVVEEEDGPPSEQELGDLDRVSRLAQDQRRGDGHESSAKPRLSQSNLNDTPISSSKSWASAATADSPACSPARNWWAENPPQTPTPSNPHGTCSVSGNSDVRERAPILALPLGLEGRAMGLAAASSDPWTPNPPAALTEMHIRAILTSDDDWDPIPSQYRAMGWQASSAPAPARPNVTPGRWRRHAHWD